MKRVAASTIRILTICLVAAVLCGCANKSRTQITADPRFDIKFGTMVKDAEGEYHVTNQTTRLTCQTKETGFRFGFEILSSEVPKYNARYVLYPPGKTDVVAKDGSKKEKDATKIVREFSAQTGRTAWSIWLEKCGGPLIGTYSAEVYINNKLQKSFDFKMRK